MKTVELQRNDIKTGGEAKKSRHTFSVNMEAIARGVQARFEENSGFSRKVTEATVNIARDLGIPEAEIEKWMTSRLGRLMREMEELRTVRSRLEGMQAGSFD